MAEFDPSRHLTLPEMVGFENRLAALPGVPVDPAPGRDADGAGPRAGLAREAGLAF